MIIFTCFLFPARIAEKNARQSYNLHNSLYGKKLADKRDVTDKSKLEGAINDSIKWLDASQEGSKEEYEEKQEKFEAIAK
jgi:heat shock protein 1/8